MRKILFVIALILLVVGVGQFFLTDMWVDVTRALVNNILLRLLGLFAFAIGVLFVTAVARRLIGLRSLFITVGLLAIAGGLLEIIDPQFVRDLIYAIFLDRAPGFQSIILKIAGAIRAGLGIAILYALARAPRNHNAAALTEQPQ